MSGPRRTPLRTCVGCRQVTGKGELVRLVRDPVGGEVRVDPTGRAPGRGAYVHAAAGCVELARKRGGLNRSLKAGPAAAEVWELLERLAAPAAGNTDSPANP